MRDIGSEPTAGPTGRARRTIRLRLTLLYSIMFVLGGAGLLAVTYGLMAGGVRIGQSMSVRVRGIYNQGTAIPGPPIIRQFVQTQVDAAQTEQLRQLLIVSGIALGGFVIAAGALGWWMAGRALRPVRTMIAKAQRLSERNLHERLAVTGPNDELKDLGDTFDGLLGRLESAFEAQTRFVANASHELRTPLTVQRAMLEVALADPDAGVASLRAVCGRVLEIGDDQAQLIEALLTLARSQRGLDTRAPVDVADATEDVLSGRTDDGSVRVDTVLGPAHTVGDRALMERLISNLVDNAVRHNVADGWVAVWTGTHLGRPFLRVVNTGPVIPADRVASLFEPFQRLETRTAQDGGLGIGLSIVIAIVAAHGARLDAEARPEGGMAVTVTFTADVRAEPLAVGAP